VQAGSTTFQNDLGGISSINNGTISYITRLPNGFLLSEQLPSGSYYYLHDALGSVLGLTDANGAIVNSYDYDPYGNILGQVEQVTNTFKWMGAVWDSSTQLYKMGDRYYAAGLARFTQVDLAHSCVNGYAYAKDNPINF